MALAIDLAALLVGCQAPSAGSDARRQRDGAWRTEALDDEPEKLQPLLSRRGCDLLVVVRFDAEHLYGRAIGVRTALQLVAQILPALEPGPAARSFGCFIADTSVAQAVSLAAR